METLVPIEAVVATECHQGVVDRHRTSEELNAVVEVGDHFHVMDGGARAHTCQRQSIDFVGRSELGSSVTDADVGQDAAVVHVVVTSVRGLVVVGGDAFHLGRTTEVGGGVAQDDESAPLASCVVGHGAVEWVSLVREDDGAVRGAFGEDLSTFGHNHG